MDFSKVPKGFSWATKYEKGDRKDLVGLFPTKYKDYDVNKLPLNKIDNYYWAEQNEVTTFSRAEGHSGFKVKNPTRSNLKKHIICVAIGDQVWNNNPRNERASKASRAIQKCRKFHDIETLY